MALKLDEIRALADRVAHSHGLDVVDIEYQGGGGKSRTLRVYIEKNREERAKFLAAAAGRGAKAADAHTGLEDVDDAELLDEENQEEEEAEDEGDPGDEDEDEEDDDDEDEMEYDHDAFLRSLPSVENLEHLSGVTHGDCEQFSRDFGTVLDVEELVPGTEYLLEVSSPGLDRRLQKAEDFRRFAGSVVKLQTFEPVAGNRHWQGRLVSFEGSLLTLTPTEDRKQKKGKKSPAAKQTTIEIMLTNVEKANLVPEF